MVFLAVIGGLIGGLYIPYAAFTVIAEALGWIVRHYGATPMWRIRKTNNPEK
jgi:hypothetical protein